MADIFSRSTDKLGGTFSADSGKITFPALIGDRGADAGLLIQNMSVNYSQEITRLFEVGSPNIYYVGGRTSGSSNVARVVGPRKIAKEFYTTYGDVCQARSNTLHFSVTTGCGNNVEDESRASFTAHFVVITTIGITVAARDMLINEQLAMMFSSLLYN